MEIGEIQSRFDRASRDYETHDALEREIGDRLLQRLVYARRPPSLAFDLGCGTGRAAADLRSRQPDARVVCLDISAGMLAQVMRRCQADEAVFPVQGDLGRLPFAARCADLVYCNLAMQWAHDFGQALAEMRRVLATDGMLLFSVPGPDSFRELHRLVGRGTSASIPIFMPDLHDVGDLLVSTGFSEPVMDSEVITLSYPSAEAMTRELQVTGGAGFAGMAPADPASGRVEVSFEVVYGTAFGAPEGRPVRNKAGETATFSVEHLRRK